MSAPLVTPSRDAAVEALARHKYETFDSHAWEAYKVEDPQGADFYRTDAACEIGALIASGAVIDAATLADDETVRAVAYKYAEGEATYAASTVRHVLRALVDVLAERGGQHG